jgi:hypothetical protein
LEYYIWLVYNSLTVEYIHCTLSQLTVSVDASVHCEHGILIRYDIGTKTVERSENKYKNSRLIINTCNILDEVIHSAHGVITRCDI